MQCIPSKHQHACICHYTGKTQLVKGKLAQLSEDMASLSISFNYFTDVISFQKILESPLEKKVSLHAFCKNISCSSGSLATLVLPNLSSQGI